MLHWPEHTLYEGIESVAAESSRQPALQFRGSTTSYGDLLTESTALAHGLSDLGVSPGDRVAVWLGNRPAWVKAQLAASYLGAAVVAVNTRYRKHELEYMLRDSDCRVLLTEASFLGTDYLEMLAEIVPELTVESPETFAPTSVPSLEHVVAIEGADTFPAVRSYDTIEDQGKGRDEVDPATDETAPACVFYTSGTTGDPKGCLQSNRSLLNHAYNVGTHFDLHDDDVAIGAFPFCGAWGHNVFMSALTHGIPLVVQTHFDGERALELIDDYDVTYVSALATMFHGIMDADEFTPERVASVRCGTIGFLSIGYDDERFAEIEERFGFPPVQPYGLSEANSQVAVGDPADSRELRQRIGGPVIHEDIEVKVADVDTNEQVPQGETGELCLRGYNLMNGYHEKPESTEAVFDDEGWFHTGDLGYRDERGHVVYESRLDDALRVRGFLVAPRDIEAVVDEHPGVELTQVVGVTHPEHGEVPIAFVKRSDSVTAEELREYLTDRIADYKIPAGFEFVEEFPRSESPHGRKIQKTELRDRVAGRYEED